MSEVQIRLDRSRPHSTCHGERTPEDPLYRVHFFQGGTLGGHRILLPFDAHGELVPDDGQIQPKEGIDSEGKKIMYAPLYNEPMRRYLKAKLEKATATATSTAPVLKEDGERDEDEESTAASEDEVNLEAWLRGTASYPSYKIRDAYARRYHKRTDKIGEIFVDLVLDERLVPESEVSADLARKYMPPKVAA